MSKEYVNPVFVPHLGCPNAVSYTHLGADKLAENYETIMNAIIKAKPAAAKGQYIKSVSVTTTRCV